MLNKYIDSKAPVHFVGVGGVGMAGLARLLIQKGVEVSGSDRTGNVLTQDLAKLGSEIFVGHKRSQLPENIQWAVRTPAVQEDNPEMEILRSRNIPVFARGDVLAAIANSRKTVAVAGAHGKTTTSAMLLHILRTCGVNAGYAIGGETAYSGLVADAGDLRAPFVVEADESDGTLMQHCPYIGILTHVEWDHVERFPTEASLCECYRRFAEQAEKIWVREEDELSVSICGDHPQVKTVGKGEHADLQVLESISSPLGVEFRFRSQDKTIPCRVPFPGEHNAWNAALALGAARELGVELEQAAESLRSYAGVGRRFQKKHMNGVTVVQDYAHHPTEVKAVLESVAALEPRKVWCVFQPHRFSRTRHLLAEFAESLNGVDHLALIPVYGAFERPEQGADSEELAVACREKGVEVKVWEDRQALVEEWRDQVEEGDVVLIAGAGDVEELWWMWDR